MRSTRILSRREINRKKRMRFVPLAAFLTAFLGWVALGASMYIPGVRSTLWPTWVLCGVATLLSLYSFAKVRPLGVAKGIAATLGLAISALFFANYFTGLSTPHEAGRVAAGNSIPALTVQTEDGKTLAIPTGKPALLVFYRGFW
jgi:hypothetical protein